MSLYLCMGVIIVLGTLLEYFNKKTPRIYFGVSFFLLACMHCLRYGQGTDYFGYMRIYDAVSVFDKVSNVINSNAHSEWGWKLFCWLFAKMGVEYKYFIVIISLFEIFLIYRFITKYCPSKMLALLLIYPTLYLTYMQSAIRQGFVLCIFLGFLLQQLLDKKYIRYFLITLVLCTMHASAYILLVLPLLKFEHTWKNGKLIILFIGCFLMGILNYAKVFNTLIIKVFPSLSYYLGNSEISFLTICERLVTYAFVLYAYQLYLMEKKDTRILRSFVNLYTFGTLVYLIFMGYPIVASRLAYTFKCLEICILAATLPYCRKARSLIFLYLICLSCLMYVKNINSYLDYGRYFSGVNIWNYPYFHIFDKLETVRKYRELIYGLDIF